MDKLHAFYTSKAWRDLSYQLKVARGGRCARCGARAKTVSSLIGHHCRIELTEDNVDDATVSLNPSNIEVLCPTCHNAIDVHDRLHRRKRVYIVWGSPLSGKTGMVQDMMHYGDIVMDMDALYQAVTMRPPYVKPDNVRFNVFRLRDCLLDQIKTRYGMWQDAYIIEGLPNRFERGRTAKAYGAELLYCSSTKDECLKRRKESERPEEWDEFIANWWAEFNKYPPGGDG